ncbi:Subtilase family protein [Nonomuraea jiangxiensis]|uniref:Subtilase family protein n=2 Tax=Nonomuraea jiangxiensis TaxID=633440 RepID=A0A1G8HQI2_9ACTN|nr:Subtilase family protein [Nonomuraea jiangxiensis]
MRRVASALTALAVVAALGACTPETAPKPGTTSAARKTVAGQAEYLVFYADGHHGDALRAVEQAGGAPAGEDARLGYLMARAGASFVDRLNPGQAIVGVSQDRAIGYAPPTPAAPPANRSAGGATSVSRGTAAFPDAQSFTKGSGEPLAGRQWDMRMIGADRAHAKAPGSRQVLVGVIDTGVDGKHPDIAPNFNRELSRNFVTDEPKDALGEELDGPCEAAGCKDPVDEDDDGHGTHVASTIASPINGIGVAGVAPGVQIVNIRAGQDSGFFFLKPSLDALTYAADIGIDVVNMSYYIDPWLFNCAANKADSKKEQLEQRAIITGMQRALDYARQRHVTLITALGNGSTDLGRPEVDKQSPDFPQGSERERAVDNTCLNVPAESRGVISVSAVGPSGRKAIYSDYGLEQTDVAAPGGDALDGDGSKATRSVLAAAPEKMLRATGRIDARGNPKGPDVVKDCTRGTCSYYQYLDGTSMAAPHATGVAAILISRFGKPGKGGLDLAPATVEDLLYQTATRKGCPSPRQYEYHVAGGNAVHDCEGEPSRNGFYGHGIVDAWKAATFEP